MQRRAIETAARARGDVVGKWYTETVSGGRGRPPILRSMLDDARAGRVGRLYVYRFDRLSRRGARDLLDVVHELEGARVELVTIGDGFSYQGPGRDMILAVFGCMAQMELEAIGERIDAAKQRLEAEGRRFGRPARMNDELVAKARKLRDRGHSVRYISAALKVPRATIARSLLRAVSKLPAKKPREGLRKNRTH